jgi:hypothetical protein
MRNPLPNRRLLGWVVIAVAVGTVSVAGVSFAQDKVSTGGSPPAGAAAPRGMLAGVHNALANLVAQGTISQSEADAVQHQADAGSIDPKLLVQSGAISDARMRIVADRLDQLKRAGGK